MFGGGCGKIFELGSDLDISVTAWFSREDMPLLMGLVVGAIPVVVSHRLIKMIECLSALQIRFRSVVGD
jgi:hypothetical protein